MITEKNKKQWEQEKAILEDAYSEVLQVFHSCTHRSALVEINKAVFALNQAIKDLEEAAE